MATPAGLRADAGKIRDEFVGADEALIASSARAVEQFEAEKVALAEREAAGDLDSAKAERQLAELESKIARQRGLAEHRAKVIEARLAEAAELDAAADRAEFT